MKAFDNDGKDGCKNEWTGNVGNSQTVDNLIRVINERAVSNFCSGYES